MCSADPVGKRLGILMVVLELAWFRLRTPEEEIQLGRGFASEQHFVRGDTRGTANGGSHGE